MKALVVFGKSISQGNIEDLMAILSYGNIKFSVLDEDYVNIDDLIEANFTVYIRPISIRSMEIAKTLKKIGKPYITYFDDDLLNVALESEKYLGIKKAVKCNLTYSSMVIGPNPILINEYSQYTKKHLSCAVDGVCCGLPEIIPHKLSSDKIVNIVLAGRFNPAYEELIFPVLDKIVQKYGHKVKIEFINIKPDERLLNYKTVVKYTKGMVYEEYSNYMKTHKYDIGIAPLLDTYTANRKWISKYLEFSKYGICGLYSNVLPYTLRVKDGVNGLLVDNTQYQWYEKLCYAIDNIAELKNMAFMAYADILENNSAQNIFNALYPHLMEIFDERTEKNKTCDEIVTMKLQRFIWKHKLYLLHKAYRIKQIKETEGLFKWLQNSVIKNTIKNILLRLQL